MALTVNYNDEGIADNVPTYLFDQSSTYKEDPRAAALEWFTAAIMGVSVHFGLSSLLGKGEDPSGVLSDALYQELPRRFSCEHFDAVDMVEMVIAAGARYLVFPAVTKDGFALYNSQVSEFNSVNSAAKRDLVGELASTCEYHGIGLILEYPFGVNRKRYAQGIQKGVIAQGEYCGFVKDQLHELVTGYGPIAGISFTGLENLSGREPAFDVQDVYDMIRFVQPNTLIGFEAGATGTEDFFCTMDPAKKTGFLAKNATQPLEVLCNLSGDGDRGFRTDIAGKHLKTPAVWTALAGAHKAGANLRVNTALMPDGSLDLEDIKTLLAVGERMETEGRP